MYPLGDKALLFSVVCDAFDALSVSCPLSVIIIFGFYLNHVCLVSSGLRAPRILGPREIFQSGWGVDYK